jgi:hypothetical protein
VDPEIAARIERSEGYIQRIDAQIKKLEYNLAQNDPNNEKSLQRDIQTELRYRQEIVDTIDVLRGTKTEEEVEEEQAARKAASEAAYVQAQQDALNRVLNRATVLFGPVRDAEEKLTKARDRFAEEHKRRGLPVKANADTPKIVNETGPDALYGFVNEHYDETLRTGLDLQGPNAAVGKAWRGLQFLDAMVSEACRSGAESGQRMLDKVKTFFSSSTIGTVAKQLTSIATQTDRMTDDLKNGPTGSSSPSPSPSSSPYDDRPGR